MLHRWVKSMFYVFYSTEYCCLICLWYCEVVTMLLNFTAAVLLFDKRKPYIGTKHSSCMEHKRRQLT